MLGFLGTVVGMIMAFFEISNVTGAVSPKLLASGIYTAMATTAVGLFVGIPAYFFYNILVTKVDRLVLKIQTHVNEFLDTLNKPFNLEFLILNYNGIKTKNRVSAEFS